jgi:hypothetical protein
MLMLPVTKMRKRTDLWPRPALLAGTGELLRVIFGLV